MFYISVFFCPVSRTLTISIFGESFDANWHRFGEYKTKQKSDLSDIKIY